MNWWSAVLLALINVTGAVMIATAARFDGLRWWADHIGRLGGALLWMSVIFLAMEAAA